MAGINEDSKIALNEVTIELSSLRSRPPRLSESDGGQAQLASGPEGIMGYWNSGILGNNKNLFYFL